MPESNSREECTDDVGSTFSKSRFDEPSFLTEKKTETNFINYPTLKKFI